MSILTARIKGIIVFVATTSTLCFLNVPANAQDSSSTSAGTTAAASTTAGTASTGTASSGTGTGTGSSGVGGSASLYLQEIAQYTNGILTAVNNLPSYLTAISQLAIQWLTPDTSNTTATLQQTFSTFTSQMSTSATAQNALAVRVVNDFFGSTVTTTSMPNANDLDYNTILGSPFFSPDPRVQSGGPTIDSAYNYVENAAGLGMTHTIPGSSWSGAKSDQTKYSGYYNTVSAVQTFDAYILSQLYTDAAAQIPASEASLLSQASNSNWFAQVASEQIGIVLRQILMYSSQTFVLLAQLLQTEKQMLATQAMTNTLLIATGAGNENLLMQRAITRTS